MGSVGTLDFIVCDDRPTLIWLAQLAALELHPSLALARKPERPTVLAFDLDPGEPATAVECAQVALRLRELFADLDLECFPKHSGSKGIQVYVPLNTARHLRRRRSPTRAPSPRRSRRRSPTAWSRSRTESCGRARSWSTGARTTVRRRPSAVYSLRCRERPWASIPLSWDEVSELADDGDPASVRFEAPQVLERVAEVGDLFAPVLELKQKLPRA